MVLHTVASSHWNTYIRFTAINFYKKYAKQEKKKNILCGHSKMFEDMLRLISNWWNILELQVAIQFIGSLKSMNGSDNI